jgi:hypothetical protein
MLDWVRGWPTLSRRMAPWTPDWKMALAVMANEEGLMREHDE